MAERRSLTPNHLSGSPPVSRPFPVLIPPPRCAMSAPAPAAMAEELVAARQKRMKMHREQEAAAAASSESPRPPATPDSKPEPPAPVAPETLTSPAAAAGKERKRKEVVAASALVKAAVLKEEKMKRKRSKHEEAAPTPSRSAASTDQDPKYSSPFDFHAFLDQFRYKPERRQGRNAPTLLKTPPRYRLVKEAVQNEEEMKRKQSKHVEAAAIPSPSAAAQILEVPAEGATARKERMRDKVLQGQSDQPPVPDDVHPQVGKAAADDGVSGNQSVSRSGKPPVQTGSEILKMRIETLKQQQTPQGFVPTMANLSSTDQDPKYSSPFDFHAFFDQFRYKPEPRQGRNAPSLLKTPPRYRLVKEVMRNEEEMKRKQSKHAEAAAIPSPSAAAQILEVAAEEATARKERMRDKVLQGQSGQPPVPVDVRLHVGEAAAHGGFIGSQSVKMTRSGKPRVLTNKERMRIEVLKQQQKPQGFIPPMANFNSIEQDPKYSSSFGAFFDQFSYKPEHQQGHNAPSVPKMPYRPARPSTRDRPPSLSDQLTANETFMAAKTTISDTEQPHSASASGSQEEVKVKGKKGSGKKMDGMKKPRKPVLTAAEKRSDMYRRLPLNELVIMPCSPHELLQERYADDPWKVIVICMLLNLTQGKQVREKVEGFFERYPDAQTAYTADPEMMAEYLRPLGLQRVKTNRIQKFSKAYVGEEWEYITELCGVGKYAADAYALFCAGRPADVVPEDHKLVDYWKFVCP